jgi:crotonobetainyl-CoA:carnitine CoA-transferase CaiB-like acyl-CoA transferase
LGSAFHAAPYGLYPTRDGYVAISMSTVAALRAALGDPEELAAYEDPGIALERRDEIYRALAGLLADWQTGELLDRLHEHGIWCAPVNDYDAVFADAAVRSLDPVVEVEHADAGPIKLLPHPISYSGLDTGMRSPPPRLGEHTGAVLAELGYSLAEQERFTRTGVTC